MCVWVYVCVYVCMCIYVYVYVYVCVRVCLCTYMYACVRACVCFRIDIDRQHAQSIIISKHPLRPKSINLNTIIHSLI